MKKNQERKNRINHVVTKSMENSGDAASLLHRLLISGLLDLENDDEIVEAYNRVEAQRGGDPILDHCGLSSDDLKSFLTYVSMNRIDLSKTPIQKVIQIYNGNVSLKPAA